MYRGFVDELRVVVAAPGVLPLYPVCVPLSSFHIFICRSEHPTSFATALAMRVCTSSLSSSSSCLLDLTFLLFLGGCAGVGIEDLE